MEKSIIRNLMTRGLLLFLMSLSFYSCTGRGNISDDRNNIIKQTLDKDSFWIESSEIYEGRFGEDALKNLLVSEKLIYNDNQLKISLFRLKLGCADCINYYNLLFVDFGKNQQALSFNIENSLFEIDGDSSLHEYEVILNDIFNRVNFRHSQMEEILYQLLEQGLKWKIKKSDSSSLEVISNNESKFRIQFLNQSIEFQLIKKGAIW